MTDVASLALRVDALEVNAASESLKRLQKSGAEAEGGLKGSTQAMEASFGRLAAKAAILYGAFQTVFGASKEFLTFDKSLKLLETQLGNNVNQVKELEAATRTLATTYGTKLTDQSAAFYEILSAGITDTTKATNLLNEANKLAIGGNANLQVTIDGLTSIIKGYGDKIADVSSVSDTFFTAALAGKTTIEELASGLGRVVPVAEVLNVTFDELAAATAALTLSGISTRESITGIRAILAAVIKPTSEAADEAERLGLEFNAAAVQSKGFAKFMDDVKQKTGGSASSLSLLFGGVESLIPALALTGNAGKEFNSIMEQMANKNGIAEESFRKLAASDQFKIDRFMAAINNIAVTLGGTLSGILAPAAEVAAKALNTLFGATQQTAIQKQTQLVSDLQDKLVKMRGINSIIPIDNIFYNKRDFDQVEHDLEIAKEKLEDLQKIKEEVAKPIVATGSTPTGSTTTGSTNASKRSGRRDAISESERFIQSLRDEARESGITGVALLELKAKYLGVSDAASPFIAKIKESEAAMIAQKDVASQFARDLDRVRQITNEVTSAEDVFIQKQNELNRLLSTGLLDPGTYFKSLEKAGKEMEKSISGGNEQFQQLTFAVQGWGRAATDALIDFAVGGKASFSDFAESVLRDIARMYIQLQLINPLLQALPGLGFAGGGTSSGTSAAASSVFTNLFKGFRASGGPVSPNSMYRVNETGIPELFTSGGKQFLLTANQSGVITPMQRNSSGVPSSGSGIVVNLIESPGKGGTVEQKQTANGIELDVMVDQLVAKKQVQRTSASNKGLRQNFGLNDNLVMR